MTWPKGLLAAAVVFPLIGVGTLGGSVEKDRLSNGFESPDPARRIEALKRITNYSIRPTAIETAKLLGVDLIQQIILLLQDPDVEVREAAAEALGEMEDADDPNAAKSLLEALEDSHPSVRSAALQSLEYLDGEREFVSDIVPLLDDPNYYIRVATLGVLREYGESSLPALPKLLETLRSHDGQVVRLAVRAVGAIGPWAWQATPELVAVLGDDDGLTRWRATEALRRIHRSGPSPEDSSLEDPFPDPRWFDEPAEEPPIPDDMRSEVLRTLVKALSDVDPNVRWEAAEALGEIGRPDEPQIQALERTYTGDAVDEVRIAAIKTLTGFGPAVLPLAASIFEQTRDPNPKIRLAAAEFLEVWGPPPGLPVDRIVPLLEDPRLDIRRVAVKIAAYFGSKATPLTSRLRAAAEGEPYSELLEEVQSVLNKMERGASDSGQPPLAVRTFGGAEAEISFAGQTVAVGLATWCPYSRQFVRTISDPRLAPYTEDLKFVFLFGDEWPRVRASLTQLVESGQLTPQEMELRLSLLQESSAGLPVFDATVLDALPGEAFLADELFPHSVPSVYSPEDGELAEHPLIWLKRHSSIPKKLLESVWELHGDSD